MIRKLFALLCPLLVAPCALAQDPLCDPTVVGDIRITHQNGLEVELGLETWDPDRGVTILQSRAVLPNYTAHFQNRFTFPQAGPFLVSSSGLSTRAGETCSFIRYTILEVDPTPEACRIHAPRMEVGASGPTQLRFTIGLDASSNINGLDAARWLLNDSLVHTGAVLEVDMQLGMHQICCSFEVDDCHFSLCEWVYLGPGDVPCAALVHPRIELAVLDDHVACIDRSEIRGLESSVLWTFPDGSTTTNPTTLHQAPYQPLFSYMVCADVSAWGPATQGVCHRTTCEYAGMASLGVSEAAASGPQASPVPFSDMLTVSGNTAGAITWQLHDLTGRLALHGRADGFPLRIMADHLPAGVHLLSLWQNGARHTLRVVKQ